MSMECILNKDLSSIHKLTRLALPIPRNSEPSWRDFSEFFNLVIGRDGEITRASHAHNVELTGAARPYRAASSDRRERVECHVMHWSLAEHMCQTINVLLVCRANPLFDGLRCFGVFENLFPSQVRTFADRSELPQ